MNEQSNIELTRQAYEAYKRGDTQQLLAFLDDQVEWELPETPGVPFTGKRRGCGSVAEVFRMQQQLLEVREFSVNEFIAQGDKVVVLGHGAWTVKATGLNFESDWVDIFTIKDGRIVAFRDLLDTRAAGNAFQCDAIPAALSPVTSPLPH